MKRRDFVVLGSTVTAGMVSGFTTNYGLSGKAANALNIGVIGTGMRGKGLMALLKNEPNIRIVACCDIIPFRLEEAVSIPDHRVKSYADYHKLLDDKDVEAVVIAVPFGLHAGIALDALDAGKHVYCEKTMSRGYEQTKALVRKVRSTGLVFQTGHQYHSSRLYTHVVKEIKNGLVGDIAAFECQWNRNGNWRREVRDPKWERMINWRMYREYSGGLVAELCSHQIDFANWVLGEHPQRVMGVGGINYWKDGRETYDNIHLISEYPSGVKATYTCTTTNSLGDYQIKVLGKKGTIMLDYTKAWFFPEETERKEFGNVDGVSGATLKVERKKGYPIEIDHMDPSRQALLDFRTAIIDGLQPESDVTTGAITSIVVQMALDAMDNRNIQEWKTDYNL